MVELAQTKLAGEIIISNRGIILCLVISGCRYYVKKEGQCVMRMVNAEFEYTYEYQGNAPKLVHTPLTDKCYLTLTQGCTHSHIVQSYYDQKQHV